MKRGNIEKERKELLRKRNELFIFNSSLSMVVLYRPNFAQMRNICEFSVNLLPPDSQIRVILFLFWNKI